MDMGTIFISNSLKLWCGVFLLAVLLGCGCSNSDDISCGGGDEEPVVTNSPDGTLFDSLIKKVHLSDCTPPQEQFIELGGYPIFGFYLHGDADFSNVVGDWNDEASFVYFPNESDKTGLAEDFSLTLYIPCTEATTEILVCPGVTSLEEITAGCSGSVTLTEIEEYTSFDGYTWYEHDYLSLCAISVYLGDFGNGFGAKAL